MVYKVCDPSEFAKLMEIFFYGKLFHSAEMDVLFAKIFLAFTFITDELKKFLNKLKLLLKNLKISSSCLMHHKSWLKFNR